jgi:hypothetical protein
MRLLLPATVLALSFLAIAGCLSDDGGKDPDVPDVYDDPRVTGHVTETSSVRLPDPGQDFSDVIVTDHGAPEAHTVRALHGDSFGLELVGYNDLSDKLNPGTAGTGWGAGGIWHEYACVAAWLGTTAIAIVDISDPTQPTVVSQTDDPLVNGDCQFTADGDYLFAGAYLSAAGTAGLENPPSCFTTVFPRGCPGGGGINVWDVHDKANPVHILFTDTGEYHTLQVHTDPVTNVTYVIQAYSGHIYRFNPGPPATLEEVTQVQPMAHDMWVGKHPVTGHYYLYTGNGSGFNAYTFDDPLQPEFAGGWQPDDSQPDQQAGGCCGWHRQAQLETLIDGKAILVVAGEDCGGGNGLPYFAIDITDIAEPKYVSSFEVPGHLQADQNAAHLCEFTTHEFSIHDGYVITANYHAGAWLFDIGSPERLQHPVVLGYYVPATEPATNDPPFSITGAQDLTWPWNPFVWGTFFDERGYILMGDFSSGMYMLSIPGVSGMSQTA